MAGDDSQPKPRGRYNPATSVSRALKRLGFSQYAVRKDAVYSGFRCAWDEHSNPECIRVSWLPEKGISDEDATEERNITLDIYLAALRKDGYQVERESDFLLVTLKNATAVQQPAAESEIDRGTPLRHEVTGKLIGWYLDGKFTYVD